MAETVRFQAIVDFGGRILAGQFIVEDAGSADDEAPSARLLPLEGQRLVSIDFPRDVMDLPGPELQRFLSQVRISWPAEVEIPKIDIVRKHD